MIRTKQNRMINWILLIGILLIFGSLQSCSSQYHLRKAIKKDPTILQTDTITITDLDTFITEKIHHDTSFMISKDTTIIIKDRMTIKHFIHDDTVYLEGECDSDTIIQTEIHEIPVEKWIYPERSWIKDHWIDLIWILILIIVLRKIYWNKE